MAGVTPFDIPDEGLDPTTFVARTEKVYSVPLDNSGNLKEVSFVL